jgi:hypothetical protein
MYLVKADRLLSTLEEFNLQEAKGDYSISRIVSSYKR